MDGSIDGPSTQLLGILACTIAGAVYTAVDEAITALGEARVRAARDGDGPISATAARYLRQVNRVGTRFLTGRILALVCTVILSYEVALRYQELPRRLGVLAATTLFYAAMVGLCSAVAARRAKRVALPLLRLARPLELLAAPFAEPLIWASDLIHRAFPPSPEDDPERVTDVVVEQLIERGEELGSIAEEDAELLKSVLEFRETVAREVMVPRTAMVAFDIDKPLPEVIKVIVERGHSRYPVYGESIDQPVGVLYAKDIFRLVQNQKRLQGTLEGLIRKPVYFAAESQKISELLRQMQARRVHLAIVVDEYGGTSGMVTLEDIIEEIVGEIRDEHDREEARVHEIAPGHYIVSADVSVHDLAEITGLKLPEGASGYDSLGGMLIDLVGKVPSSGQTVEIGEHALTVRAADERHVTSVEVVTRADEPEPAAATGS